MLRRTGLLGLCPVRKWNGSLAHDGRLRDLGMLALALFGGGSQRLAASMKGGGRGICRNRMRHVFMGSNTLMLVEMMRDGLRQLCV